MKRKQKSRRWGPMSKRSVAKSKAKPKSKSKSLSTSAPKPKQSEPKSMPLPGPKSKSMPLPESKPKPANAIPPGSKITAPSRKRRPESPEMGKPWGGEFEKKQVVAEPEKPKYKKPKYDVGSLVRLRTDPERKFYVRGIGGALVTVKDGPVYYCTERSNGVKGNCLENEHTFKEEELI